MQFFINKYDFPEKTFLSRILFGFGYPNISMIGITGSHAAITKFDLDGNMTSSVAFHIENSNTHIYRSLQYPNGDYLLYGRRATSNSKRNHHLMMRVDQEGQVLWIKTLHSSKTRSCRKIVQIGDQYAMTAWYNRAGTQDEVEVIKVDENGNPLAAKKIKMGHDDQVTDLVTYSDWLIAVGGSNASNAWTGFLILMDYGLSVKHVLKQNSISNGSIDDIYIAQRKGQQHLILAGRSVVGQNFRIFFNIIGIFPNDNGLNYFTQGIIIHFPSGDNRVRKIIEVGNDYYLLGIDLKTYTNYVLKFSEKQQLLWARKFDLEDKANLTDLTLKNENQLWLCGTVDKSKNNRIPLVIKTDLELTTCKTVEMEGIEVLFYEPSYKEISHEEEQLEIIENKYKHELAETVIEKTVLCPTTTIDLTDNTLIQSPFLYLQSAGSMGNISAAGILLRWFLLRNLSDHLPKANYAGNTNFFNKPDDFVTIYRSRYDVNIYRSLSFKNTQPISIDPNLRRWVYQLQDNTLFYLSFQDTAKYDSLLSTIDPVNAPYDFLNAYHGSVLELEIRNALSFAIEYHTESTTGQFSLQSELFSVEENLPLSNHGITGRQSFQFQNNQLYRQLGENIKTIRFRLSAGKLKEIRFETYQDYLLHKVETFGWTEIGQFALTKNTTEAFKRLEDSTKFQVHGHWQKYNDDAFVNINNYKDRWNLPTDGLAAGVDEYISLSDTDPLAMVMAPGDNTEDLEMQQSYLTLLNFAAADYHNARMLGLGHIDTPGESEATPYIYVAEYHTQGQLDTQSSPNPAQHFYMTPPITQNNERLPQLIEPLPVEYGLSVPNGTGQPFQITDANGYIPYGQARYIRIKAKLKTDYRSSLGFFHPATEFSSLDYSAVVFSGVEYREQGVTSWQKPEIAHDDIYKDAGPSQDYETLFLPFDEDNLQEPVLIHKETQEGFHEYACYAIDIYSRGSALSNPVVTDYTQFTPPNTLIPPHNAHVQLVQKEFPLILTSQNEQNQLVAMSNNDKTLVRLTFYYSHLHDINYGYQDSNGVFHFGDQVEVFFRELMPRETSGGIGTVQNGSTSDQSAWVHTQDYTFNSNGQTIIPNLAPALKNNFIGGILAVNGHRYLIEDIVFPNPNGDHPRFKVAKKRDQNVVNLGGNGLGLTQSFEDINAAAGDLFSVIENMANANSWDTPNPLSFHIAIGDNSWTTKQDNYLDPNDELVEQELRGVWDTVHINDQGNGTYIITFDNYVLNNHPQFDSNPDNNSVNWYKGLIRVNIVNDTTNERQKKVLEVLTIDQLNTGNKLVLTAYDETYSSSPTGERIKTGSNIEVNFYPGYRAYLVRDTSSGFTQSNILPVSPEDNKKTLIGLRSVDTTTQDASNNPYHSRMGVPMILFAQLEEDPGQPGKPEGPLFTTEPDFFGKCNYSLTLHLNSANPFATVIYRADINAILHALYEHVTIYGDGNTIAGIKHELSPPAEDVHFTDRFSELANVILDSSNQFAEYNNYRFPVPDNAQNGFDGSTMDVARIKEVIFSAFTPLTEQPLLYQFISNDPNYIPRAKKQTIKDQYGQLLNPTDPEYDQAPMAKRLAGKKIQFTDFSIDGNMAKETAYFYCAREINKQMRMGDYGDIWGPVQLINTRPPESPIVKKFTTQLADLVTGTDTAVNFHINDYPKSQNVKKIEIYRAFAAVDALSPRTMEMIKSIDLSAATITDGIVHLQDDFDNDNPPPFGETLFYKLVGLKEVIYEDRHQTIQTKWVPSKPSSTLLTNIVDVFNPEPPLITPSNDAVVNDEIPALTLSWTKTAHNAKYYLFKMNSVGNWNKITEIASNDVNDLTYTFADPLIKLDDDGNTVYHRFKVTVENSSGLLNLTEDILTV